jgi:hypothetical protein
LYLTLKKQKRTNHNKIQETLGINWRTAKKYADEEQLPKSKKSEERNDVRGRMERNRLRLNSTE